MELESPQLFDVLHINSLFLYHFLLSYVLEKKWNHIIRGLATFVSGNANTEGFLTAPSSSCQEFYKNTLGATEISQVVHIGNNEKSERVCTRNKRRSHSILTGRYSERSFIFVSMSL